MKRLLPLALLATLLPGLAAAAPLTQPAETALLRALDDEYHAEAVYAATLEKFGQVRPFSKIINAERKHEAALIQLLTGYGVAVPANPWLSGAKTLPALPETLGEVCALGVTAEIENARLYDAELLPAVSGYDDITRVFEALSAASKDNHLPAFQRCAGN